MFIIKQWLSTLEYFLVHRYFNIPSNSTVQFIQNLTVIKIKEMSKSNHKILIKIFYTLCV